MLTKSRINKKYIWEIGRQPAYPIKENEADSKLYFLKKSSKKKKENLICSFRFEIFDKQKIFKIRLSCLRNIIIIIKHISKDAHFITKYKKKSSFMHKKCLTNCREVFRMKGLHFCITNPKFKNDFNVNKTPLSNVRI